MNIYDSNGYLDVPRLWRLRHPFIIVTGGRGIGKTYGALTSCLDDNEKFVFFRRTQKQIDLINTPEFSPFKKINADRGINIITASVTSSNAGFYYGIENEKGKTVPQGAPIGYTAAISTMSNIRGFDASDCTRIIYDEFIPEKHERPIKNESDAVFNAYETINRNRELSGHDPVKMLFLSNSNDIGNPIFMALELVNRVEKMIETEQEIYFDNNRGIALIVIQHSPISEQKAHTALYRLTANSGFSKMALDNDFLSSTENVISSRQIREYIPILRIGELTICKHKNGRDWYVTPHAFGAPAVYGTDDDEILRFRSRNLFLWQLYMNRRIVFETRSCELIFRKIFT